MRHDARRRPNRLVWGAVENPGRNAGSDTQGTPRVAALGAALSELERERARRRLDDHREAIRRADAAWRAWCEACGLLALVGGPVWAVEQLVAWGAMLDAEVVSRRAAALVAELERDGPVEQRSA